MVMYGGTAGTRIRRAPGIEGLPHWHTALLSKEGGSRLVGTPDPGLGSAVDAGGGDQKTDHG